MSVIDVWNKADAAQISQQPKGLSLSARTGEGLQALREKLLQQAGWQQASEGLFIARERHVQALRQVQEHLQTADAHLAAHAQNLDLLAEELRDFALDIKVLRPKELAELIKSGFEKVASDHA